MKEEVCKHKKFGGECSRYHERKICSFKSCNSKGCRKCHSNLCKYFREKEFCKYGRGCAYAHVEKVNKSEIVIMTTAIKNMKADIDDLKSKLISLSDIKKEGKLILTSINTLKEDIKNIIDENLKICENIRFMEEEVEESDSEECLCDEGE